MKKLVVIFIVLQITSLLIAEQRPKLEWVARYMGPGDGYPLAMAIDGNENVYVTGAIDISGKDYTTIKYDKDGKECWIARYDGPGQSIENSNGVDEAYGVAVDHLGNVYVTGTSQTRNDERPYLNSDFTTIKYTSDGKQCWVKNYKYGGDRSIFIDESGNICVNGIIKYDPTGKEIWKSKNSGILTKDNSHYISEGTIGRNKSYITKFALSGKEVWKVKSNNYIGALTLDCSDNIYMILTHDNKWDWSGCTISSSYLIAKFSSDGKQLWQIPYDEKPTPEGGRLEFLKIDRDRNVYIAGNTSENTDKEIEVRLIKINSDGKKLWERIYSEDARKINLVADMILDNYGNIYLVCCCSYSKYSDESDIILIKCSSIGEQLWAVRYDDNFGSVRKMAIDNSGNIYVTGSGGYKGGEYVTIKYSQQKSKESFK